MEDPTRLRSKLRLDLNDIARQIEEMEEILEKDKSTENVEAHRKLVEYEKKLKDQYEKMTGITLEQASTLSKMDQMDGSGKAGMGSKLLGLLTGLLIFNGYYNITLHSIDGFAPTDLLNYYGGTGKSIGTLESLASSIRFDSSTLFITIPLVLAIVFSIISFLFANKGSRFPSFLRSGGFSLAIGYFLVITLLPDTSSGTVSSYENNIMIFAFVYIISGFLVVLSMSDNHSKPAAITILLAGIMIIYSGIEILLVGLSTGDTQLKLLYDWPWIMLPMMLSGLFYSLASLLR